MTRLSRSTNNFTINLCKLFWTIMKKVKKLIQFSPQAKISSSNLFLNSNNLGLRLENLESIWKRHLKRQIKYQLLWRRLLGIRVQSFVYLKMIKCLCQWNLIFMLTVYNLKSVHALNLQKLLFYWTLRLRHQILIINCSM